MVVCHCLVINDRVITELANDGSTTVNDVIDRCGAGGRCGGCQPSIERILSSTNHLTRVKLGV